MSLGAFLLIFVILMLVGVLPIWGHSVNWGYLPTGGVGLLVVLVLVLVIMGRI